MPSLAPGTLIFRHIEKLRKHQDAQKVDQVLAQAGLTIVGEHVTKGGRDATFQDCQTYKQAIRAVHGDAIYSFAKVNFVLGGCTCGDCNAGRGGP